MTVSSLSSAMLQSGPLPEELSLGSGGRIALIAGEGLLPVKMAECAKKQGLDFRAYTMDKGNLPLLKQLMGLQNVGFFRPGLLAKNIKTLQEANVKQLVFAGKINKWTLICTPMLDSLALSLWRELRQFNDDHLMLALIDVLRTYGFEVIAQTTFLEDVFLKPAVYTHRQPSQREWQDIELGTMLAREMGRLDVGQTVITHHGMVLAVETIEGTDQAILRSGKWKKGRGGVVCKVEKPDQDKRFDIPTVGPRTLKRMKKAGLTVLAVEAGKTIVLDFDEMIPLANKWQIALVAV